MEFPFDIKKMGGEMKASLLGKPTIALPSQSTVSVSVFLSVYYYNAFYVILLVFKKMKGYPEVKSTMILCGIIKHNVV